MGQLTSADLRQPKGDISDDWFPLLDSAGIDTLLTAYLDDAYSRIPDSLIVELDQNAAARAWAMARASRNVLSRLANTPGTMKLDNEASQTITAEQIKTFRGMADKYESEFQTFTESNVGDTTTDEGGTGSARNSYSW